MTLLILIVAAMAGGLGSGFIGYHLGKSTQARFPVKRQFLLHDSISFINMLLNPTSINPADNLSVQSQKTAEQLVSRYEEEVHS